MTKYNHDIHHRRSVRVKGYDYSQAGLYFITICTQNREHLFGRIENGEMILNDAGRFAERCWLAIPEHYPQTELHEYVITPNHVHGIVGVQNVGVQNFEPLRPGQNQYKKIISRSIGAIKWFRLKTSIHTRWQRNFYKHIIRDEKSLLNISEYIIDNPMTWRGDRYYG
jgi:putative transposase